MTTPEPIPRIPGVRGSGSLSVRFRDCGCRLVPDFDDLSGADDVSRRVHPSRSSVKTARLTLEREVDGERARATTEREKNSAAAPLLDRIGLRITARHAAHSGDASFALSRYGEIL